MNCHVFCVKKRSFNTRNLLVMLIYIFIYMLDLKYACVETDMRKMRLCGSLSMVEY